MAVFTHKDNPIKGLSLDQLDGIFSSTNKRGGKPINTWGELGLTGEWANRPISLYGRNSASGTYGFFKEHALKNGDFRSTVKEQPGSSSVVQGMANDLGAIGYSGIGYKTSGSTPCHWQKLLGRLCTSPRWRTASVERIRWHGSCTCM